MIMKLVHSTIVLLFFCIHGLAQDLNTEHYPGYRSEHEYQVLNDKNSDILDVLLLTGNANQRIKTETVAAQIADFTMKLRNEGVLNLSEKKLIQTLHAAIHDEFLKKYEEVAHFYQLFESGTYNCVSSTALFAYVLDEFEVPYSIQELPNHVYLIAWPGVRNIQVEMTSPKDGYFEPSNKEVSKAVHALRTYKLIGESEFEGKDDREIYNDFFFRDQSISLRELAGLQYFNEAIVLLEKDNKLDAYDEVVKADLLNENNRVKVFKSFILTELLDNSDFSTSSEFRLFLMFINQGGANLDKISYEYAKLIQNELVQKSRRTFIDTTFVLINNLCTDTIAKNRLGGIYYGGMAEYYAGLMNWNKAFDFVEAGVSLEPNNSRLQYFYAELLFQKLINKYEGEELVEQMELAMKNRSFLNEIAFFQVRYFYSCYDVSTEAYESNDGEIGDKYFQKALDYRNTIHDKESIDLNILGWLYAEKGAFLYRKGKLHEAKDILEQGLLASPDHERILARKKIVDDKIKGVSVDEESEDSEFIDQEPTIIFEFED